MRITGREVKLPPAINTLPLGDIANARTSVGDRDVLWQGVQKRVVIPPGKCPLQHRLAIRVTRQGA